MHHQGWDLNHEWSCWQLLVQDISLFLIKIWLEVSGGTTSISMRNTGSFRKELLIWPQCMNKSYSKWKSRVKCSQKFIRKYWSILYAGGRLTIQHLNMETWKSSQLGQRHFQGTLPQCSLPCSYFLRAAHLHTTRWGDSCTLTLVNGPRTPLWNMAIKRGGSSTKEPGTIFPYAPNGIKEQKVSYWIFYFITLYDKKISQYCFLFCLLSRIWEIFLVLLRTISPELQPYLTIDVWFTWFFWIENNKKIYIVI